MDAATLGLWSGLVYLDGLLCGLYGCGLGAGAAAAAASRAVHSPMDHQRGLESTVFLLAVALVGLGRHCLDDGTSGLLGLGLLAVFEGAGIVGNAVLGLDYNSDLAKCLCVFQQHLLRLDDGIFP